MFTCELHGHVVVAVGGKIDLPNADALETQLVDALDKHGPDLIIDVAELSFVDSSGLLALFNALRHARRLGGKRSIAALQRAVRKFYASPACGTILKLFRPLMLRVSANWTRPSDSDGTLSRYLQPRRAIFIPMRSSCA